MMFAMSTNATSDDGEQPDGQLLFLEELVHEGASVSGDVLEIDSETFAIYGSIAVDGDVIMAEYGTESLARKVLDELHHFEVEPEN
jgi:hypothetical protein